MAEATQLDTGSVRDQVSAEEWALRVDLAACYRLCAHFGWNDYIFTHISVRLPGAERHYLINPFGLFFDEVTASNLVKIDQDGEVLIDETGLGYNIGGYVIHGAIHEVRDDAHCVIHLHTNAGVAVSGQKDGLLPLNQDAMSVLPDLAYHDFEGIALDTDERERLISHTGDKNAVILRNHGLLTMGATVAAAFSKMYMLQKACSIQVMTLAGGAELGLPSQAAQDKVREQVLKRRTGSATGGHGTKLASYDLAWQGYLRKLDKMDSSYKD